MSLNKTPYSLLNIDSTLKDRNSSLHTKRLGERSGSVVECLTRDRRSVGSSLAGVTALCPSAGHIKPCLVLIQP